MISTDQILEQVKSLLIAGMSAKITELNTDYGDSVVLNSTFTYFKIESALVRDKQTIFIYPDSFQGGTEHTSRTIYKDIPLRIKIIISHSAAPGTLSTLVYRYERAINEIIMETVGLNNFVNICSYEGTEYLDWDEHESGAYNWGAILQYNLNHLDEINQ